MDLEIAERLLKNKKKEQHNIMTVEHRILYNIFASSQKSFSHRGGGRRDEIMVRNIFSSLEYKSSCTDRRQYLYYVNLLLNILV